MVWLDNTTGTWGFSYDAGKGNFKSAKTFTGTGTNRWREETFTITDAVMNHNGPRGADIALVNLDDQDEIFHLIEVQRGAAKCTMRQTIFSLAAILLLSASVQAVTISDNAGLTMELGTDGSVSGVALNRNSLSAGTGGGFYLQGTNDTTKYYLTGTVVSNAGQLILTLTNAALQAKVTVTNTPGTNYIEMAGVLEDLAPTKTNRALWLGFNVPVNTLGWNWGHNLNTANPVITSGAPGYSGDDRLMIPIPAVWTNNTGGISLCIPPTDPCVFENSADADGVRIRMAYGLTPMTTQFPLESAFPIPHLFHRRHVGLPRRAGEIL